MEKSYFKKLSVENILKWQKREIDDPLLRMENVDDVEASRKCLEIYYHIWVIENPIQISMMCT